MNATEQDGYTIIEMERALETCDSQDDITLNVVNYNNTLWYILLPESGMCWLMFFNSMRAIRA